MVSAMYHIVKEILQVILRSNKTDDIRVCNVDLGEFQVFRNGERQLRRC